MHPIDCNTFFKRALDLLCICGFDGYFKRLNPLWATVVGYSIIELESKPFIDFVHPDDREKTLAVFQDLINGKPFIAFENRYICADGNYKWLLWTAVADFEAKYIYSTARDITQQKLAEGQIQQLTEELQKSNVELEQFAYVASHDLQEPLRMVTGYCQLLERRYSNKLDTAAKEFIGYAVSGTKRMQSLINDLLTYSRVIRTVRQHTQVVLTDVLRDVLNNLEIIINDSNAKITNDALPVVYGDMLSLERIFQNLISNSIKFKKPDVSPVIHIGVQLLSNEVVFSVSDNGIGIDPNHFHRLFVIFQRLHTQEEYTGTGIGLAVVKKLVMQHGGRIWVESVVNHGATFYFTIPIRQEQNGS